jgi:GTP-binding protein HflX
LRKIEKQRVLQASSREKNNTPLVSIVGYTNAGKSTLLRSLTNSEAYVADELFATVDSLQRELPIKNVQEPLNLSDTVGFIQNLPTTLIESFKSTLLVATSADLLIHVVDAATAIPQMHIGTVRNILEQINVSANEIMVFNKIDRLDRASLNDLTERYPQALFISSLKNTGIEKLVERISSEIYGEVQQDSFLVEPKDLEKVNRFCEILEVTNSSDLLLLEIRMRSKLIHKLLDLKLMKESKNVK